MQIDNTKSLVLELGDTGNKAGPFNVRNLPKGRQEFRVRTGLGQNIQAVWWTPMFGIGDLVQFRSIEIRPAGCEEIIVATEGRGELASLQIQLYLQY